MERVTYEVNSHDEIIAVGDDWVAFARTNAAAHLTDRVIGRSLWDFVSGPSTQHVYRELLARVRAGRTTSFAYRCDSPELRRFMRMTMIPRADGVVAFDSVTLRTETRVAPIPDLLSANNADADPGLRMCSWCKRVAVAESWEELETAVENLGLFALSQPPSITHAVCPTCFVRFIQDMDAA